MYLDEAFLILQLPMNSIIGNGKGFYLFIPVVYTAKLYSCDLYNILSGGHNFALKFKVPLSLLTD